MIIGIDASRCRSGGSKAHIQGILRNLEPKCFNITTIHIWSYPTFLDAIPNYSWLKKHHVKSLTHNLFIQVLWQSFILSIQAKKTGCSILLTLDATSLCRFKPQVVISRDLLSYEPGIKQLYGFSYARLRIEIIKLLQNYSFRRAKGVIFLTQYAKKLIEDSCGSITNATIIPHGFDKYFSNINHSKQIIKAGLSITCVYISNSELYKHQKEVILAIELLRKSGYKINLKLIGGGSGLPQQIINNQILKSDPSKVFIEQLDFISRSELPFHLEKADIFIFASSCEAFGITLLEAMATGVPIACSNRSALPELLGKGGVYFDPEKPSSIAKAILHLIENPNKSIEYSKISKQRSIHYSWERCSNETFSFIYKTLNINYDK